MVEKENQEIDDHSDSFSYNRLELASDKELQVEDSESISSKASAADLTDLYLEGKDPIQDKKEFLDIILRLPYVANNNLKAIEVFERWKKMQKLYEGAKNGE